MKNFAGNNHLLFPIFPLPNQLCFSVTVPSGLWKMEMRNRKMRPFLAHRAVRISCLVAMWQHSTVLFEKEAEPELAGAWSIKRFK